MTGARDAALREAVEATKVTGETSDGYHTFNELYHHRAVLFSVIVRDHSELSWKSKLHYDGTMYDGMFIVGVDTPQGQATYHYDVDPYWEMFECRELERAPEWDGHTPSDAIERIATLGRGECTNRAERKPASMPMLRCSECGCATTLDVLSGGVATWAGRMTATDELLDYAHALELALASNAIRTNPTWKVRALILAMRGEFAPNASAGLTPLHLLMDDAFDVERMTR